MKSSNIIQGMPENFSPKGD